MRVGVRGAERKSQAAGPRWNGGRADRLHQQTALAQAGRGQQRALRSAEHDGKDRGARLSRKSKRAEAAAEAVDVPPQDLAPLVADRTREQRERDPGRGRDRGRQGRAEDERAGLVDELA